MTGSLQIKKGHYYVALNTYVVEDGKKRRKPTWIPTNLPVKDNKRKAEQMLVKMLAEHPDTLEKKSEISPAVVSAPDLSVQETPLFTGYLLQWLEDKKFKVELNSWESYETYVKKHVVPYFKKLNLRIDEVMPKHIKEYYNYKFSGGRRDGKEGGMSIASIKRHATVMNQAFDEALIDEIIDRNPMDKVPIPKQKMDTKEKVFLTDQEANEVLQLFRGHQIQPLLYVTLYYGLRRSEVVGLKWDTVNFQNNTLSIQHTVVQNKTLVAKDRTKSASSRQTYELLPEIKEVLLKLRDQRSKTRNYLERHTMKQIMSLSGPTASLTSRIIHGGHSSV